MTRIMLLDCVAAGFATRCKIMQNSYSSLYTVDMSRNIDLQWIREIHLNLNFSVHYRYIWTFSAYKKTLAGSHIIAFYLWHKRRPGEKKLTWYGKLLQMRTEWKMCFCCRFDSRPNLVEISIFDVKIYKKATMKEEKGKIIANELVKFNKRR